MVGPQVIFVIKLEQIAGPLSFRPRIALPTGLCSPPPDFSMSREFLSIFLTESDASETRRKVKSSSFMSRPRISATRTTGTTTPCSCASGSSPQSPPIIPVSRSRILSNFQPSGIFPKAEHSPELLPSEVIILKTSIDFLRPLSPMSKIPPVTPWPVSVAGSDRSTCSAGFRNQAADCPASG